MISIAVSSWIPSCRFYRIPKTTIDCYVVNLIPVPVARTSPCVQVPWMLLKPRVGNHLLVGLTSFYKHFVSVVYFVESITPYDVSSFPLSDLSIEVFHHQSDILRFTLSHCLVQLLVELLDLFFTTFCSWCVALNHRNVQRSSS